jgi:ureidoacrylate peracid hydrolase
MEPNFSKGNPIARDMHPNYGTVKMTLACKLTLVGAQVALLFLDVQNFSAYRQASEFTNLPPEVFARRYG